MSTGVHARGFELTAALRAYVEKRLRGSGARFRHAIDSIRVYLSDLNGPRGGIDKYCRMEVRGPALQPIIVRERDADLYAAIDRAAGRLDQAVSRRLARRWDLVRRGGP